MKGAGGGFEEGLLPVPLSSVGVQGLKAPRFGTGKQRPGLQVTPPGFSSLDKDVYRAYTMRII